VPLPPTPIPAVRRLALALLLTVLWESTAGAVFAQPSAPDSVRRAALTDFHGPDLTGKDGPLAKAGLDLLLLYHRHRSGSDRSPSIRTEDASTETSQGGLQIQNGRVVIDAVAAGDVTALAADLDSLGMTDVATAGGLVSGRVPIPKIPALARLETLRGVQPARARTHSDRSTPPATPNRSSRPAPEQDPAPDRVPPADSAAPAEAPALSKSTTTADSLPASDAAPGDEPSSSGTEPPSSSEENLSFSSPPVEKEDSMAIWGLAVLMAVVLFLEER